ncbi:MAG: zinc ribbon domain-containing protein [Candidatus Enterosoma sp.]|nr:zinc ribbon domain-containing protein [Candidatus Enterosoma sp.]
MSSIDNSLLSLYRPLNEFLKEHKKFSFLEFDYQTGNNINLFLSSANSVNIDEVYSIFEKINRTIPSIERIFKKPVIHLKEEEDIVPTEACRTIDNKTITHLAMHPENWQDIKDEQAVPRNLLTRIYLDNYSIYENVLFVNTVNNILSFLKMNIRMMKDLLDNSSTIQMNYLDKADHLQFYLALAKLHTSYVRNFNKDAIKAIKLINSLLDCQKRISCQLNRPIYRRNYKLAKNVKLKSTNILNMQKDYHRMFKLALFFHREKVVKEDKIIYDDEFFKSYFNYCMCLILFSSINFSFTPEDDGIIDTEQLDINLKYKSYRLNIKTIEDNEGFLLTFYKEKEYRILLLPFSKEVIENRRNLTIRHLLKYDEVNYLLPFYESRDDSIYLSINNLNSFRRIQQILLKGMIYSSIVFDVCPFCGEELQKIGHDEYFCPSCFTSIKKKHCPIEDVDYYESKIHHFSITANKEEIDNESYYHYRNITQIADKNSFICPRCHKVHKD